MSLRQMSLGASKWTSLCAAFTLSGCLSGCGGSASRPSEHGSSTPPAAELEGAASIASGSYRLTLSATCGAREVTATGALRLEPMARQDAPDGVLVADGALLWGHADLDLEPLEGCFRRSLRGRHEPIHPSVLMEVLKWDEGPRRQVLLVSTEPARAIRDRASGAGLALWVQAVEGGRLRGVWSRWELRGGREGDWEAELVAPF